MILHRLAKSLGTSLLVLSILAATVAAAPAQEAQQQFGVFGKVVEVDGDVLHVRTKKKGDVRILVTGDTTFRSHGEEAQDGVSRGDRIAAVVTSQGDLLTALEVMVVPRRAAVVHRIGVVTEVTDGTASLVTEDGRRMPVEFGLNRTIPVAGTVVTVVGRLDRNTGVVRARHVQRLEDTLERLSDHLH